jgi:hypothetical protein
VTRDPPSVVHTMNEIRVSLPTLVLVVALASGASFAAGRAIPTGSGPPLAAKQPTLEQDPPQVPEELDDQQQDLPVGHPAIGDETTRQTNALESETPPAEEPLLEWKAPARWQLVPNPSTMRLATYRVPRVPGDAADAELSITRAGGSADANADRWIHQFDEAGQKTAKRTMRAVGLAEVAMVEAQGTYSGGMGQEGSSQPGWALVGAIASTPGMPYFFKLTGPEKSVRAARREFDALIDSLVQRRHRGT